MEKLTPMMRQYLEIKEQHKDSILFFRLGDFYEMFFDDAIEAARILDIALTGKSCGLDERAPMCGVPYHSAESYIQKLIQGGKKVAICEQVEDPKLVKGIVKREVVKIVTPGTNLDDKTIESHKNIYLMACEYDESYGCSLSYVDISTGEFNSGGFEFEDIIDLTAQISPKEIIFGESFSELLSQDKKLSNQFNQYMNANMIVSSIYSAKDEALENFFTREYISELAAEKYLSSIELVLTYILYTQKIASRNISKINILKSNQYLKMDLNTRRNLELTENINTKNKRNSLFDVLDHTSTNIGKRTLRKWIEKPLIEEADINFRLDLIDELISKFELREDLKEILSKIYDIERICSKISYESIGTKEIVSLKTSIERLPILIETVEASQCEKLKCLISGMDNLHDIYLYIDKV
ncbi:MAG: DNA mismatch repair protein MutS, partial [Proteocatella sp.]